MRLIDADALRAGMCAECALVGEKCLGDECDLDSIKHIDEAPTVKAIPVEWIREKRDALKVMKPGSMSEKLLTKLLMVWHWEQCEKEAGL